MIRAIFFDLDGTLINLAPVWRRCLENFMAEHPDVFPQGTRHRIFRELAMTYQGVQRDRRQFAEEIAMLYPALGLSPVAISTDFATRLPASVEPDPAVLAMLADLSDRYKTAIVTNGSRRVQRAKLERAGLAGAVGHVFISGEMGTRKPYEPIFREALAWAGVAAGDALFVGDHPYADINAARKAGLQTCAVDSDYEPYWPRPDFQIDRVIDLPGVLT